MRRCTHGILMREHSLTLGTGMELAGSAGMRAQGGAKSAICRYTLIHPNSSQMPVRLSCGLMIIARSGKERNGSAGRG